jgi:hypothetical protein
MEFISVTQCSFEDMTTFLWNDYSRLTICHSLFLCKLEESTRYDAGKGQETQPFSFCLQVFEKCSFFMMMGNSKSMEHCWVLAAREGSCVEALSGDLAS